MNPGSPYPQEPFWTLGDPRGLSCAVLWTRVIILHVAFGPCEHLQATGVTTDTKIQPRKASPQKSCYYLHLSAAELQNAAFCNTVSCWKSCKVRNEKRPHDRGENMTSWEKEIFRKRCTNAADRGQLLSCDSFWRLLSNGIYNKKH